MLKMINNTQGVSVQDTQMRLPNEQGAPMETEGFGDLLSLFQQLTLGAGAGAQAQGDITDQGEAKGQDKVAQATGEQQPATSTDDLADLLSDLLQALQQVLPENINQPEQASAGQQSPLEALVGQIQTMLQQLQGETDTSTSVSAENVGNAPANFSPETIMDNELSGGLLSTTDTTNAANAAGRLNTSTHAKTLQQTLKLLAQLAAKMDKVSQEITQAQVKHPEADAVETENQPLVLEESDAADQTALARQPVTTFSQMDVAQFKALHQKIQHAKQQLMKLMHQKVSSGDKVGEGVMPSLSSGEGQQAALSTQAFTDGSEPAGVVNMALGLVNGLQPFWDRTARLHAGGEKSPFKTEGLLQGERLKQVLEAEQVDDEQTDTHAQEQGRASGGLLQGSGKTGGVSPQGMAQTTLSLPVKHPEWGQRLAQRVLFLAQNSQQMAQIRLHPAHLGPIQVKMKLEQDQSVQVSLHAHHALTREAIEQAIPRLKELFAQEGLVLGGVQVQADAQGHAQSFAQMRKAQQQGIVGGGREQVETDGMQDMPITPQRAQEGLIDHFV